MTFDAEPPFAPELATRPVRPAGALVLPNGSTPAAQLVVCSDVPPFAPELVMDKSPHEEMP